MTDDLARTTISISADELISRYASGERKFRGSNLSGASLAGQSLEGIDLSDSNLSHANLQGARLCFAQLHRCNLSSANLHQANLLDADLSNTSLADANAEGAMMLSCIFDEADLRRTNLNYCTMAGVRLVRANLSNAELICTNLSAADLTDAILREASFGSTVLCEVNLAVIQGLAYSTHTGLSYVDVNTLRATAKAIDQQPHRVEGIQIFLKHCGLNEQDLLTFPELTGSSPRAPSQSSSRLALIDEMQSARILANDPLRDFFVWWDRVTERDVEELSQAVECAADEEQIQRFLAARPQLLIQHLGGGHGRWVLPKKQLGSEHVTDFIIGERDSLGFHWCAVELESPKRALFTKEGDVARYLNRAIRQILDWRNWLTNNISYASRLREESGLGLTDITGNVPGLILIGRRADTNNDTKQLRRRLGEEHNISIHTYDYLVDAVRGRSRIRAM